MLMLMPLPVPLPVLILVLLAIAFFAVLLYGERRRSRLLRYCCKPATTLTIIGIALAVFLWAPAQTSQYRWYVIGVLLGLICSLGGDIALMFDNERWFLAGLILFLIAHVVYFITFFTVVGPRPQWIGFVVLAAIGGLGGVVYRWIHPHLEEMKVPVGVYFAVLSAMVWAALRAWGSSSFQPIGALCVGFGAVLFYCSDLILGYDRFYRSLRHYYGMNLGTYFAGQTLIALSVYLLI